jgi:tetratricopeptide (TPR) repeat protein
MLAASTMAVTAGDATSTPTPGAPLTASDYAARGKAYLEQGDYEQAIAAFSEALRLDPVDTDAYRSRGNAYYEQGEHDLALADLHEYARLAGEKADPAVLDLIAKIEVIP